ncbi:hypothetical protein HK098_000151 [Nowakowskiella sp. JEL0407]|nr:hypothetical protein HK098_000151 [Nowakowskiella sp. JEL0407]
MVFLLSPKGSLAVALIVSTLPNALSQPLNPCVKLTGSQMCPYYNDLAFINITANIEGHTFSDIAGFDRFINSTINSIESGLFANLVSTGCSGISSYMRYPKTVICSLLLNYNEVVGTCNDAAPLPNLCKPVCTNFTQILSTVMQNNPTLCPATTNQSTIQARTTTINTMTAKCNAAPASLCVSAMDNEQERCGFTTANAARTYCTSMNNVEPCCSNITNDPTTTYAPGCFAEIGGFLKCDMVYGIGVFLVFALISGVFAVLFLQEQKKNRPISYARSRDRDEGRNRAVESWAMSQSQSSSAGRYASNPKQQSAIYAQGPPGRVPSVIMPNAVPVMMVPASAAWGPPQQMPMAGSNVMGEQSTSQQNGQKLYRVIQSFKAEQEGDIELLEGDQVTVDQDLGGGWVSGVNMRTREEGVFPKSHAV